MQWRNILSDWCTKKPIIKRAWCFGSRVTGTYTELSDLDIAIDIDVDPRDDNHDDTWLRFKSIWKFELSNLVPITIDLCHWHPDGLNKVVSQAIQTKSIIIYDRSMSRANV